ncbi:MAG: hypothetical protein KDB07_10240, partial [Planctomycetes bacterium]|nr:hypothetical protein [Planctomycetota bacterium]
MNRILFCLAAIIACATSASAAGDYFPRSTIAYAELSNPNEFQEFLALDTMSALDFGTHDLAEFQAFVATIKQNLEGLNRAEFAFLNVSTVEEEWGRDTRPEFGLFLSYNRVVDIDTIIKPLQDLR